MGGSIVDIDRISIKDAKYRIGKVVGIDAEARTVTIEGQSALPFDHLVVCVGISFPLIVGGLARTLILAYLLSGDGLTGSRRQNRSSSEVAGPLLVTWWANSAPSTRRRRYPWSPRAARPCLDGPELPV